MNFLAALNRFATGTYTVTRRGPTTVGADGRADLASPTTFTIQASVQNLSGRDLQMLTEGMRTDERKKLYTTTKLQAIGAPDVVTIGTNTYTVETVEGWDDLGQFFKVIVAKDGN